MRTQPRPAYRIGRFFYARDLYKTDVQRATVMSIYLLPEVT